MIDFKLSFIVLTYNNENTLIPLLRNLRRVKNSRIYAVDSFSEDGTTSILKEEGVEYLQNVFLDYGSQRNYALDNLKCSTDYVFCIDSDEILDDHLVEWLNDLSIEKMHRYKGYFFRRRLFFLGKFLRFGGVGSVYHLRLFHKSYGRCETTKYDQHFLVTGPIKKVKSGSLIDPVMTSLNGFIQSHNKWSDLEASVTVESKGKAMGGRLFGTPIQRRRFIKNLYSKLPKGYRGGLLFIIRFFFLLGFLDGYRGFVFHFLNAFWFRTLVDAKIYEKKIISRNV